MKNTRTFKMNGKNYTSMMDIARELGVKRVYPRDFAKYGIEELTDAADDNQTVDTVAQAQVDTDTADDVQVVADDAQVVDNADDNQMVDSQDDTQETAQADKADKADEPKVDKRFTRKLGTADQIKEAQDNAGKMNIVDFNNYIKHFTVDALVALADAAGVKNWDSIANEPIRKMRLLMEIKAFYYPNDKTPVKGATEWKKVSLNDLMKLAKKNKLVFKTSDDEKIQRMWVIMAIKAANLTLNDLPQTAQADKADKQVAANA